MRDAAGERAHRLQLLRLAQLQLEAVLLGLGALAFRDIDGGSDEAVRLACRIAQGTATDQNPMPFGVSVTNAIFDFVAVGVTFEEVMERGVDSRPVVGVDIDERFRARVHRHIGTDAQQLPHLGRHERGVGLEVPVEVPFVCTFHRKRVALFTLAQRARPARRASIDGLGRRWPMQ